ncbi:MAG TPA: hypothetical protein VEA37_15040 [Flavobacterium sp.]|nr:hypothetical protein [Flavobacterium sp.]
MNIGTPIERKEVELAKKESMMRPSEQQNLVETVKTIGNQINFCKVEEIAKSSPNSISNWVVGPDRQLVTKTSALLSHYTRNGTSNQQIGAELFKLRLTTHVNAIKLSPILKSSGLVFPKETNFDEFIRENSSLQWFLASNTLDIFGTDGSKGIKFVGIVPGGPNLGDLSLILVDKRTGKCAEMVVDLTSGVNPTETMDLKLQTLQNQFNSKYSWSNKESLRDYGPRKQPRLYPLIDKSELESSGKLGLRLYEIDLYETGKPRLIHSGDLSNHLQNHPRINYVRPSDLMFVDHQGYCRTMLGKPIYDSKSLVTPLTTKGLLGSIPDFLSFF